jgi:hypothetical protein
MNKKEKLSGQTVACREASNILYRLLNGDVRYGFLSNEYASDESKKAFRREIERISFNLGNRHNKLFARLGAIVANEDDHAS